MTDINEQQKDTREIIIDAAKEVFGRFGYAKTTMNDIARAIGKGKSSIYHYFTSKEELFKLVVEREAARVKDEIMKVVSHYDHPQEKLKAYALTRSRLFIEIAQEFSTFQDEYLERYSFIQTLRKEYDAYEVALIQEILEDGVNRGFLEIENISVTAFAMSTALKGLEYPWAIEKDVSKVEKYIDVLIKVVFNGIAKR